MDIREFSNKLAEATKNMSPEEKASLMKMFESVSQEIGKEDTKKDVPAKPAIRLFSFSNLDSVIHAARLLHPMYHGANTLYKNETNGIFILALAQSAHTNSEFSKICNMLSEYGSFEKASGAVLAYLEEHCQTVISADAVRHLAEI